MFSDGETLLPNIIGVIYTITLYRLSFTKLGKKIFKETYKFNYKLLKQFKNMEILIFIALIINVLGAMTGGKNPLK